MHTRTAQLLVNEVAATAVEEDDEDDAETRAETRSTSAPAQHRRMAASMARRAARAQEQAVGVVRGGGAG